MPLMRSGSTAWGVPSGSIVRLGSTDANLFSSSLPVFPHDKLKFTDLDHGVQSADDTSSEMSRIKDAMDDLDLQEIGSLLPDDEDELLAGIINNFDPNVLLNQVDELEDYDIFDSGGGIELDSDPSESLTNGLAKTTINNVYNIGNAVGNYGISNGLGTVAGEHPYGEHPSRTLFVRNINSNVEESELCSLFEQYGAIRTLYTACKHRGFVMVSYYDIRAARNAMRALQNKPLRRRKLDIHFSIPKDNPSDKDMNQGTLVIFNLDPLISNDDLLKIFGAYGEVKEIRETPNKKHHKFIEFYDVRAAETALRSLNRIELAGRRIKLEHSRPGGARRNMMQHLTQEMEHDDTRSYRHQMGSPMINSPPGSWAQYSISSENSLLQNLSRSPAAAAISPGSNHLPGLATVLPPMISNPVKIAPIGREQSRVNNSDQIFNNGNFLCGVPVRHSQSFPEHDNGIIGSSPRTVSSVGPSISTASGIGTLNGPQFLWGSPHYSDNSQSSAAWQSPPMGHSFTSNGNGQGQGKGIPYSSRYAPLPASSLHHPHPHPHVGSAPSGIPFERQYGYFPESPDTSFMSPFAFGGIGPSRNDGSSSMDMIARAPINAGITFPRNISENGLPNFRMMPSQRMRPTLYGNTPYSGVGTIGFENIVDRGRARRVDGNVSLLDSKKQYQLDLGKIANGEDTRTTLMIKNIPNKYTSKMLLAAIDESHKGTYDFIYLPIDFKNKCNVGYAFINMVSHSHIISFYEAFNGKKWEKFNSEKVASLAYARIQGKTALVTHFQNSSLMNEDKRCRPILFNSQDAEAEDQELFLSSGEELGLHQQDDTFLGTSPENPTERNLNS